MIQRVLKEVPANNRNGQFNEIIERFEKSEDPLEKFRIIDELEHKGGFRRPKLEPRIAKNNETSRNYRNLGNVRFNKRTNDGYTKALKQYNKALCYAENGSEELGLGFASRSAVYFELGLYDICIENIHLARQTVSARNMDELNNREAECVRRNGLARKKPMPVHTPKLNFPANVQIPFIANCLKVDRNEQYGRHIRTTVHLKVGDVVAVEEAFCSTLDHKYKYERCEKCLKENNFNLMPCRHCVRSMFCDTCRDEAYEQFHKLECPVVDLMAQLLCTYTSVTLRTVIRAITSFESAESLTTHVEEISGQDLTIFDCDYTKKSSYYAPVYFMAENCVKDAGLSIYIVASLIAQPLLELTELKDTFSDEKAAFTIKLLIQHHLKRIPIIHSRYATYNKKEFFQYASGVHPLRDLLNHSCAPNLFITSVGNKFVYTVLKPIEAGEQLFDNYNVDFRRRTRAERQEILTTFRCQCMACQYDYRLESEIGEGRHVPNMPVCDTVSFESMRICAAYLNKYSRYYPCKQLLRAESQFRGQLVTIYQTEVPMEERFK
ncbi:SET and MYND domain-containing protein 4-like [Bradysia coprophila]|uniref:SET and MYND domain-containing protein 4-like n=1 Tax=Bradysia coprophila TaxID=38358 RepID=UPI00187DB59F|nr:SET and MYND domain-containing protein 4-like [Bradysia coprophila]